MSDHDELLLGADRTGVIAHDSDGDGVSDVQESLDGTDPNDAGDSIRHDAPVLAPSSDPRGDLRQVTLESETAIDVTTNLPEGKSLEQSLPTGLDGKAIPTGPAHYGNADADKLFGSHANSANTVDTERNPALGGPKAHSGTGAAGTAGGGLTAGGEAKSGNTITSGGNQSSPPPGVEPSGSADPGGPNHDLVSEGTPKSLLDGLVIVPKAEPTKNQDPKEKFLQDSGKSGTSADQQEAWLKKTAPKYDTGEGDSGDAVPSGDEVARVVAVHAGATDVVRGHEAPQIDTDAPPANDRDLVTNPNPDGDTTVDDSTATVTPPGQQISKPVNPQDGLPGGLDPSAGTGGTGGTGGGGGGAGGNDPGLMGVSSAATAAESTGPTSGVTNIGSGSTSGIHSVADGAVAAQPGIDDAPTSIEPPDVTGMKLAAPTDDSGRAWQGSTVAAGDDDDLEELEVERYVAPDADQSDDASSLAAPDFPPLDPVADAMDTVEVIHDVPDGGFAALEINHDLAVPAEVDLDDGF